MLLRCLKQLSLPMHNQFCSPERLTVEKDVLTLVCQRSLVKYNILTLLLDKQHHPIDTTVRDPPASLLSLYPTTLNLQSNLCLATHSTCLPFISPSNTSSPSSPACSLHRQSSNPSLRCSATERASGSRRELLLKHSVAETRPLDYHCTVLKPILMSLVC